MNRRRPWHQRLVRRVTRHVPLNVVVKPSPLGLMSAFTLPLNSAVPHQTAPHAFR
jgi:hypothetical protein